MSDIRKAINMQSEFKRRRARAPEYDLVRRDFELGLAQSLEMDVQELLMPLQALQTGLGGEIVLRAENELPGLELTLKALIYSTSGQAPASRSKRFFFSCECSSQRPQQKPQTSNEQNYIKGLGIWKR